MFKNIHGDIRRVFRYTRNKSIKLGFASMILFMFLRNYVNFVFLIDLGAIIGSIAFLVIVSLAKHGKINAYYHNRYLNSKDTAEILKILSLLVTSAYVRMLIYIGFLTLEINLTTDIEKKSRTIRNALMPFGNYLMILIVAGIVSGFIYYLLYFKKDYKIQPIKNYKIIKQSKPVKNSNKVIKKQSNQTINKKELIRRKPREKKESKLKEDVFIRRQPRG